MNRDLRKIFARKAREVGQAERLCSLAMLQSLVSANSPSSAKLVAEFIKRERRRVIAHCAERSMGGNILRTNYDPGTICRGLERAGAVAVAVATDSVLGGVPQHLAEVNEHCRLPLIRNDYIIDEYQIYQTRYFGGQSYFLYQALIDQVKLQYLLEVGRDLGMEAMTIVQGEAEARLALESDAAILVLSPPPGIDLKKDVAFQLLARVIKANDQRALVYATEQGGEADLKTAVDHGFTNFLLGEILMLAPDPGLKLKEVLSGPLFQRQILGMGNLV